jgi:hypothetical protein
MSKNRIPFIFPPPLHISLINQANLDRVKWNGYALVERWIFCEKPDFLAALMRSRAGRSLVNEGTGEK